MKGSREVITRRDFLKGTACTTLAAAMGFPAELEEKSKGSKRTRVILVRDPDAMDKRGLTDPGVIQRMLDQAVSALLNKEDPLEAWKLLINPTDVVGIKSNEWGPLPTPTEVEQTIKRRILNVGVPEGDMSIDDRGVLRNPIFRRASVLVNACTFRTHHWSSVGGCLKNYIMFVRFPFRYHGDSCANLGAIWKFPKLKGKTRLNVLVVLHPLFHGIGPHHFSSRYTWDYKGILVGTDPVALDAVGLSLLRAKRIEYFGEDRPLSPPAKHIAIADAKYNVGVSDLRRIELVKLGWKKGSLI